MKLNQNLHICKLNSELVYPWTVMIFKKEKDASSNHDLYIYILYIYKLYVYFTHMNRQLASWHLIPPAFEDPGGAVVASAQRHRGVQRLATLLAATEKARCAAARLDSEGREDFLRFGNCFKVPVLIFIFESWYIYISNQDYPLRCNPVSKLLETGRIDLQTLENRLNWGAAILSVTYGSTKKLLRKLAEESGFEAAESQKTWLVKVVKEHFFCCCHVVFLLENLFFLSEWQLISKRWFSSS